MFEGDTVTPVGHRAHYKPEEVQRVGMRCAGAYRRPYLCRAGFRGLQGEKPPCEN